VSVIEHSVRFRAGGLYLCAWQEFNHVEIDLDETKVDDALGFGSLH
jgi:hypothetical protein